tara:strand:+ start:958 stop:1371 length:414 start_codon:yes stop_codon:yes gene_type:complete
MKTKTAIIIGIVITGVVALLLLTRKKKGSGVELGDIAPSVSGKRSSKLPKQWDSPYGNKCANKDFWEGYHYDNTAKGQPDHVPELAVGAKVLVFRKDYEKENGKWVWKNPRNRKLVDRTIATSSINELERELKCLGK